MLRNCEVVEIKKIEIEKEELNEDKLDYIVLDSLNIIPETTLTGLKINKYKQGKRIKFRIWNSIVKSPNKFIILKENRKTTLWGKIDTHPNFKRRYSNPNKCKWFSFSSNSFRPHEVKLWKENVLVRLSTHWDKRIDLSKIKYENGYLLFEVPKGYICLIIQTGTGAHGRLLWEIIPSKLKWKKSLFLNALGFYLAEGNLSNKAYGSCSQVAISNSDFGLLDLFLNFSKQIISKEKFRWFFMHGKDKRYERTFIQKIIKQLNLKGRMYCQGSSQFEGPKYSWSVEIFYSSQILRALFVKLLDIGKNFALKSNNDAIEFLKGWWAGDGGVNGRTVLNFNIHTKHNQHLALKLFKKCGILSQVYEDVVSTNNGFFNIVKLTKMGLCSLRTNGKNTEIEIIKKLKKVRTYKIYETLLMLDKPKTTKQLSYESKKAFNCVRYRLYQLENKKYLTSNSPNRPKYYKLTEEGKNIYNTLLNLELMLK